ncbi:hypothetical protein D3C79_1110030 [compost metagenome]
MKDEDTDVQAQKVGMTQRWAERLTCDTRFAMLQGAMGVGYDEGDQQNTDQGKSCRGQEQS